MASLPSKATVFDYRNGLDILMLQDRIHKYVLVASELQKTHTYCEGLSVTNYALPLRMLSFMSRVALNGVLMITSSSYLSDALCLSRASLVVNNLPSIDGYIINSNQVGHSNNTRLLEYNVHELTKATCIVKDELDNGTTRHIGVAIDTSVLVKDRGTTTDCINMHTIGTSGSNVVVSNSEDGLKELVEHNKIE